MSVKSAMLFAKKAHGDQKYGSKPYMYHLIQVANTAIKYGGGTTAIICCLLHDTIEDTSVTKEDVARLFGNDIAHIIDLVTNRPSKEETYKRIATNKAAKFVKLCDRIANAQDHTKIEKYRNDYPLFKKILYKPGEFEAMWNQLDYLLGVR